MISEQAECGHEDTLNVWIGIPSKTLSVRTEGELSTQLN